MICIHNASFLMTYLELIKLFTCNPQVPCNTGQAVINEINRHVQLIGRHSSAKLPSDVSLIGAGNVRSQERRQIVAVMPYVLQVSLKMAYHEQVAAI